MASDPEALAIVCQPMATAPTGNPVRLVLEYEGKQWVSEKPFVRIGEGWFAQGSSFRLPGHLTIKGWMSHGER